jgi:predicted N-acetyltransferase YhbS
VLIRPASASDLGAFLDVMSVSFGVSNRAPSVHSWAAGQPDAHMLVAERDGAIVATGAGIGFGPTAWIGAIAVRPEARGQRLGQRMTEAVIEALGERETLLLLASASGRPIYERMGFEPEGAYRVFYGPDGARPALTDGGDRSHLPRPEASSPLRSGLGSLGVVAPGAPTPAACHNGRHIRPAVEADYAGIRMLDALATGEDRGPAVGASLDGALVTDGGVALRPPFAARPIVATDPGAGRALLAAAIEPGMRLAAPVANAPAVEALLAHRCVERDGGVVRMRRGAPVAYRPELLWGVFSLFFG